MSFVVNGELWCDRETGLGVRCGVAHYPCAASLLPRRCHEYDAVCARIDRRTGVVTRILRHALSSVVRRPHGLPTPAGVRLGTVTSYDVARGVGVIDRTIAFDRCVVRAIGDGQVERGESVEYRIEGILARASSVTGHFGTAVSHVGKVLSAASGTTEPVSYSDA